MRLPEHRAAIIHVCLAASVEGTMLVAHTCVYPGFKAADGVALAGAVLSGVIRARVGGLGEQIGADAAR